MLRRTATPSANISVSVSSRPLYPGDVVDAEIAVTPRETFVAAVGLLRLSQTEVLRIDSARDAIPQMMLPGRRGRMGAGAPDHVDRVFIQDAQLEGGATHTYPVQVALPSPAPPTVKGKYAQITWQISAAILANAEWVRNADGLLGNLTRSRAGESSQELVVFTHPDAAHIGGERLPDRPQATRSSRNVNLDLSLDSGLAVNGGEMSGTLSVQAHQPLRARELRVELVRWERSGNKQARVVESSQVLQRPAAQDPGDQTDWAFRLHVPDRLMPSVLGQHTFVGWQVRGIIVRTLRPNLTVSQLVQIYTSP